MLIRRTKNRIAKPSVVKSHPKGSAPNGLLVYKLLPTTLISPHVVDYLARKVACKIHCRLRVLYHMVRMFDDPWRTCSIGLMVKAFDS